MVTLLDVFINITCSPSSSLMLLFKTLIDLPEWCHSLSNHCPHSSPILSTPNQWSFPGQSSSSPGTCVCVLLNCRVEPSFSVWHMSFFIFWAKRISQPTPNTHTQLHPHDTWPIPARVIPSWTWRALIWYGEWRKEMSGCVVHRMRAWDSMCLWSQHTGDWGRRIAIWGFQAWPCHRREESRGKNKDRKGEGRGAGRERNNYGGILLLFEEEYSKEIP